MKQRLQASPTHMSNPRQEAFFPGGAGRRSGPAPPPPFFQAKLRVGEPGDRFEREADRVADEVVAGGAAPALQRMCMCTDCAEDSERELRRQPEEPPTAEPLRIRRHTDGASGQAGSAPAGVGSVLASSGRPLEPSLRRDMEQRFGHDFSPVRVHAGGSAEQSARELNARAYTVGHDIVFGAGQLAPATLDGRRLLAHELTHVIQQSGGGLQGGREGARLGVQRKCGPDLGSPAIDCTPSQQGVVGWQLFFRVGCDDLLPGEKAKIDKLKPGSLLKIHGFASRDGSESFNDVLSCHRAHRIAELVRSERADCPVIGIFKHGESPVAAPGVTPDANPPDFWRSVIVEEVKPAPESGETWLDPSSTINQGWAWHARAQQNPTPANLDAVAARRTGLKTWLESISKTLAPAGAELNRRNLDDYRRFYASAEKLWIKIDQLLAIQKHAAAAKDTYNAWALGSGRDRGSELHAQDVPAGAKYHIDLFGEGYFPGAVNIGDATRTSTTGVHNTRVPNLIYRHFTNKDARIPIADHAADLVTSENGPLLIRGLIEEIARIVAPGGTIVLYGPENMEEYHDKLHQLTGGAITKVRRGDEVKTLETKIVVPGP